MSSNEAPSVPNRPLGDQMVRTASLFQAIVAFPGWIVLSIMCFAQLIGPITYLYDFIRSLLNGLMAAAIMFLVIIQLKVHLNHRQILKVEIGKSVLATLIWLWLVLDAAFGPWNRYYPHERLNRLVRAFICGLLLLILFFPTLGYAIHVWLNEKKREPPTVRDVVRDESTPLLDAFE